MVKVIRHSALMKRFYQPQEDDSWEDPDIPPLINPQDATISWTSTIPPLTPHSYGIPPLHIPPLHIPPLNDVLSLLGPNMPNPQLPLNLDIPRQTIQFFPSSVDLNGPPPCYMTQGPYREQYPENALYFAVSPRLDQKRRFQYSTDMGATWQQCWWIKLGDGTFRESYGTHNPDVGGVTNMQLRTHVLPVEPSIGSGYTRRNAKAFELELFKGPSGSESRCEWYRIRAKSSSNPYQVELDLNQIFRKFGSYGEDDILLNLGDLLKRCRIASKIDSRSYNSTGNRSGAPYKQHKKPQ